MITKYIIFWHKATNKYLTKYYQTGFPLLWSAQGFCLNYHLLNSSTFIKNAFSLYCKVKNAVLNRPFFLFQTKRKCYKRKLYWYFAYQRRICTRMEKLKSKLFVFITVVLQFSNFCICKSKKELYVLFSPFCHFWEEKDNVRNEILYPVPRYPQFTFCLILDNHKYLKVQTMLIQKYDKFLRSLVLMSQNTAKIKDSRSFRIEHYPNNDVKKLCEVFCVASEWRKL